MTRKRTVLGSISTFTGGHHKRYAVNNIEQTTEETITNTGIDKGLSFNNAERAPAPEIRPRCIVQFRPHGKWNGEYGFDWLRGGDTGMAGDVWFGSIMGKYYESDNKTPYQDTNKWNNNFHKSLQMYNDKLNSYRYFTVNWKKIKGKPYQYTIATLTLLKGKSATLNLKVEIAESPKKLTIEFKDKNAAGYFDLNIREIGDIKKGKYDKFNYLKITCKKECPTEQLLLVKADGEICGALRIHPNDGNYRHNIKVVFIKVKTDINNKAKIGLPVAGGVDFFKQCFHQALVVPDLTIEPDSLDCTGNFFWNEFKHKFCTPQSPGSGVFKVTKQAGLRTYLESKLKSQFGNKYNGYYAMFFVGEYANWNGFSNFNSHFGVYFASHNAATLAHETMHAMNLPHTFDGKSPQAKYTYQAMTTNNLLDYSHVAKPPIPRYSLFLWQWKIINSKIRPR